MVIVLLTLAAVLNKKPILTEKSPNKTTFGLPVRLVIPLLNINANIQHLGVAQNGEMEVPSNIVDVGWFKLGPSPGKRGSAVIAGHLNGKNNEAGVFANLDKLKPGDNLSIEDKSGKSITFIVQKKELYRSGYADEVFSRNDGVHLNLITCDGLWDESKKSFTKRLVVFADIK